MNDELTQLQNENRHFTTKEVFIPEMKQILGFTEENYIIGRHSQEFYEINIVLKGKANHYIGKRRITVSTGDAFIIFSALSSDVEIRIGSKLGFSLFKISSPGAVSTRLR